MLKNIFKKKYTILETGNGLYTVKVSQIFSYTRWLYPWGTPGDEWILEPNSLRDYFKTYVDAEKAILNKINEKVIIEKKVFYEK